MNVVKQRGRSPLVDGVGFRRAHIAPGCEKVDDRMSLGGDEKLERTRGVSDKRKLFEDSTLGCPSLDSPLLADSPLLSVLEATIISARALYDVP